MWKAPQTNPRRNRPKCWTSNPKTGDVPIDHTLLSSNNYLDLKVCKMLTETPAKRAKTLNPKLHTCRIQVQANTRSHLLTTAGDTVDGSHLGASREGGYPGPKAANEFPNRTVYLRGTLGFTQTPTACKIIALTPNNSHKGYSIYILLGSR